MTTMIIMIRDDVNNSNSSNDNIADAFQLMMS